MIDLERDWLRLHLTPGLGRKGLFCLMERYTCPTEALSATPGRWIEIEGLRAGRIGTVPTSDDRNYRENCRIMEQSQVRLVSYWDEAYPSLLRNIPDPPALLYLRGAPLRDESFAVVGSRSASTSGRRLTHDLSCELASRGICIVSGLARGIDTAAHEGALDGNGPTVAVLGCGIDRIYPPENARLFERMLDNGGTILSEYTPGTPPLAGHFPGRNRLISGLCRGVLIVEAAEGSGSLITADFALEQGREVFAVPAGVYSPVGGGVNRLLKDGAYLVTEARDILERLWPAFPTATIQKREADLGATLPVAARAVYLQLSDEPLQVDDLSRKCGLTPPEVSAILLDLELNNCVEQLPGMRFVRNRRP